MKISLGVGALRGVASDHCNVLLKGCRFLLL